MNMWIKFYDHKLSQNFEQFYHRILPRTITYIHLIHTQTCSIFTFVVEKCLDIFNDYVQFLTYAVFNFQ